MEAVFWVGEVELVASYYQMELMELFSSAVVEEMKEQEEHLDEFQEAYPAWIVLTNQEEVVEAGSWLEATLWRNQVPEEELYTEEGHGRKG